MFFEDTLEDAVSPVVGVILMVAVTVILAAVIGSFVLDLGNNVQANPQAGVTFSQDTGEVTVQVISMENADDLTITRSDKDAATYSATLSEVGSSVTLGDGESQSGESFASDAGTDDTSFTGSEQVTVVGNLDGKQAVLQTYTYDGN